MGLFMADFEKKTCKIWRKGLEVHRECSGSTLKLDFRPFNSIERK